MSKALLPIEQKQVLFYEDEVTAVRMADGVIYVPIRPLCRLLTVDWDAQRRRILRDPVLSEAVQGVVVTTTPGGAQEMTCLPLDYLSGWLFGINANRVKDEIRERLIRYQRECYKVLGEAFQEGRLTADTTFDELLATADDEAVQAYQMALAVVKLARSHIQLQQQVHEHAERLDSLEAQLGNPERLVAPEQASQISQAVKAVALALGKQTGRNEFGAIYGELYRRFEITSYKSLPSHKFEDALAFLTEWYQTITTNTPF